MNKNAACLLLRRLILLCWIAALSNLPQAFSAVVWSGANSGTDLNWSDTGNWSGGVAPTSADDVKFFDAGTNALGTVNNIVDTTTTISSLQYGNTNGFHTTQIANGATLNITGGAGLFMMTSGDIGAVSKILTNTITGVGGSLNINNVGASIALNQGGGASPQRATIRMDGLDTFTANLNRIGLGSSTFTNNANAGTRYGGQLILARSNYITLAYSDTLANYQLSGRSNAIELSRSPGNNPGNPCVLQLGQTNVIYLDSIGCGMDKSGNNNTPASGVVLFNPAFVNPVAYFRGKNGGATDRVTWWSIGDGNASSSSSNGGRGTNDFSGGTVDILANFLSLGRDCNAANTGWAGPHSGVLTFTAGTIDVNTAAVGNQAFNQPTSIAPCAGTINVNGTTATLKVNTLLTLGNTTAASGTVAVNTSGNLNINGGKVYANKISVGGISVTNNIRMAANSALVVSNTLATNASGLFLMTITNSTLALKASASGLPVGLIQTLTTSGANTIQLDSAPVLFSSYPQQIKLLRYTTLNGAGYNFSLATPPDWATGAYLSNNVANPSDKSIDLILPTNPAPVISSQPQPYAGSPGDNVIFSVTNTGNAPLTYGWYYTNGASTVALSDGNGPSGSSTLSGTTTGTLSITAAQPGDNGYYFVVITNVYGAVTSSPAQLIISAGAIAPSISLNDQTNIAGTTATIAASVSGNPFPTLQWRFNGIDLADGPGPNGETISGSTASTLTIANLQYPANQGTYSLVASNSAGKITNNMALTVYVSPGITTQPTNIVVTNTQSASFTVVATGVPAPTYQWKKNGVPISSSLNNTATNATFTIANAAPSDMGIYSVTVSNAADTVTAGAGITNSVNVTLTVNSTMSAVSLSPTNAATGVCYDTPLTITFSQPPVLRATNTIRIYNVTNPITPVDTINLSLNSSAGVQSHTAFFGDGSSFNYYPVVLNGNTASIYPHSGVMTSNQTYYVTVDNGVFADAAGAYFAGISNTNSWKFTTKVGGAADPVNPVVNSDGTADFATVQGAIDSLPANAAGSLRRITIKNGTYFEIVNIGKTNVTLRGESRTGTIINYPNNALITPSGSTHARMTFKVNANDVSLDNLTVTNSTPQGGSQAEAFMIESNAKRVIVNNCEIDSRQDTILANGSSQSLVYFNNSRITGNFDYIWGGGVCYFNKCVIHNISGTGGGNLTAARTDTSATQSSSFPWANPGGSFTANGISFVNCIFEADPNLGNVTLAASNGTSNNLVCWSGCQFGTNYVTPSASLFNGSYLFWQYQNVDSTGTNAVSFSSLTTIGVTNNDPRLMAATNVSTWFYGWSPALAPNIISQPTNLTVNAGNAAAFSVTATAIPDATYQWLQNGTNSPYSANSPTLTIPSAQSGDAGSYSVVVANSSGSVTSSVVTLTVIVSTPPTINGSPQLQNDGNIQLSFSGSNGAAYRVWASTNLTLTPITSTWTLLSSGTFGASPVTFTDSNATNYPQRFYIISSP